MAVSDAELTRLRNENAEMRERIQKILADMEIQTNRTYQDVKNGTEKK